MHSTAHPALSTNKVQVHTEAYLVPLSFGDESEWEIHQPGD